jgi:acetyl-CoA acetyltransferase
MSRNAAAIAGIAEWKPQRSWAKPMFALEAMAQLAAELIEDGGFAKGEVDGLVISHVPESPYFAPSAVAEYLGIRSNFNEIVDLGGATAAGMVWRAAAAIEVGICNTVLALCPSVPAPAPRGASEASHGKRRVSVYMGADAWGSPQSLYEIPSGLVAATPSYALMARRYMAQHGVREETLAKIAVHERYNAQANPNAIFWGKPLAISDVMRSRTLADPIKLVEAVMPCYGGAGLLITSAERAARARHRPALIAGFGEQLTHKSITYMPDLLDSGLRAASERAFRMAGMGRDAIDLASIYDCFTITVLVAIENAGFCPPGQGGAFVEEHDFRYDAGDWPLNTHGGQLGFGQPGLAGGMSHITELVRQIQGRSGGRQLPDCERGYCSGTGGMMSEHVALILEGA